MRRLSISLAVVAALLAAGCQCGNANVGSARPQIDVEPQSVDFGATVIGQRVQRQVTVRNEGRATLSIQQLAISGDHPDLFTVDPTGPVDVPAGGQAQLTVAYLPAALGSHSARLLLHSDAANTRELVLSLSGTGHAIDPCASVTCTTPPACHRGGTCVQGTCQYELDPAAVELDAAFCARLGKSCGAVTAPDSCGMPRTANCGSCTSPQSCGGAGTDNVCGCAPEDPAAFCARLGKDCGAVTAVDNCELTRTESCGDCSPPKTCAGEGVANVCGCAPETDAAFCARTGTACGMASGTDNCGVARSADCGPCGSCAFPDTLSPTGGTVQGMTSGTSAFSSTCGGATAPEKVYRFTPAFTGPAAITTCGSNFDAVLTLHDGSCTGPQVGCNDNSTIWCGSGRTDSAHVNFNANAGTTYYVVVDGAATASGAYTLKIAAPGGTCSTPYVEPADGGTQRYAMFGNSTNTGSCGGNGVDRVHEWKPAKSGPTTVTLKGEFWPAALYVRSGACSNGAEVACDYETAQWPTNTVTFNATAGTTYYLWVSHGSYNGPVLMWYDLTVSAPP